MYDFLSTLLITGKQIVVGGAEAVAETTQAAGEAVNQTSQAVASEAAAGGLFGMGGGILPVLSYFVIIGGAMWFFMIRPQRKRDKALKEMQENLRPGDNIVTTSGLYGKIVDVGDDVFVVEFGSNRGIRIPVGKADVVGVKEPKLSRRRIEDTDSK